MRRDLLLLAMVVLAAMPARAADLGSAATVSPPFDSTKGASVPKGYVGPLAAYGRELNDAGFYPILFAGQWYVSNPGFGVDKGSHQWQTQINGGFDYYFEPLTGLRGTSIHFLEGYVPYISNNETFSNYFTHAGDVTNASAAGFVPLKYHLLRFTAEQQLFDNRLFVEGGKGYANDYVARPDCLNAFTCMSVIAITHKASGFNFPNYSNWLARAGVNITPEIKLQGIWYEYDNNAAYTNGWEWSRPSNYPAYLGDIQYANPRAAYPFAYEFMYYYNRIPQTDQLCFTCKKTVTNWQSGIFASGMHTIWRPGLEGPTMLQAFVSVGTAFNDKQTESPSVGGLLFAADAGLTLRAPFASRPLDAYSIQLTTVRLTDDEQTWLTNQGFGKPGPTEYALDFVAKFKIFDYVFFSPYVEVIRNANAAFASNALVNPDHKQPKDGYAVGATFTVSLADLFGLNTRASGYDGHYP